jgi:hypothetical protein
MSYIRCYNCQDVHDSDNYPDWFREDCDWNFICEPCYEGILEHREVQLLLKNQEDYDPPGDEYEERKIEDFNKRNP